MWYTPTSTKSTPLSDRRGQQFGPLVLTRTPDGWQLDHWPTGLKVLPSAHFPFEPLGYNRLRRIASRLRHEPALRSITLPISAHREEVRRVKYVLQTILSEV